MLSRAGSSDSTNGGSPNNVLRNRRRRPQTVSQYELIQQQEQLMRAESWQKWQELVEYILFLVLGGIIWMVIAWKVLQWQKFPFHLYPVEVGFIFVGPVVLLAGLLYVAEWLSRPRNSSASSKAVTEVGNEDNSNGNSRNGHATSTVNSPI